jgi:hypothetical protein
VGDWAPEKAAAIIRAGGSISDVVDLALEDGFVELLRSFRTPRS